ncbi:LemA family protein [Jinshanibacter sp. LJY008]|uniref:LemA family protein n=1 Tax=Limnobaculum eriocheiris TaxID=2897391 RepID=A0A9X1MVT8_9GAMM|nr:LemA family protein [Limnobaculum eriocheiris]MCD1125672.1 LemA family protein [Limnobaculum eriocheiris]
MLELWIPLGIIVLVIVIGIVIYNGIVSRMNAVARAWADVVVQERQKNNIIPDLEKIAAQYSQYESSIMAKVTELRTSLNRLNTEDMDLAMLSETRTKTSSLLSGLYAVAENYPDLKASSLYNNLMAEISEQQENIGAAIRIFNQNVEDFNNGIEVVPNSLINSLFNKKRKLKTFSDAQAESGFEYRPDIH